MSIEVMRQALVQLELNVENLRKGMSKSIQKLCARENQEAITALRLAIEQAERVKRAEEAFAAASEEMKGAQEPVAWMNDSTPAGVFARHKTGAENFGCTIALYTAPPQRQPLTDEEIWYLASQAVIGGDVHVDKLVRAIEAAHGIGGKA